MILPIANRFRMRRLPPCIRAVKPRCLGNAAKAALRDFGESRKLASEAKAPLGVV